MLGTRGVVTYAISMASRYLANPGPQHMKLTRRILRYLNGTKSLRLTYKGQSQTLKGYTDADWAGCRDTRRSTAGYLFNIGSGPISWQLKRQSVVVLSTFEAEFLSQTQATKQAMWLRRLLNELNISQGKAATILWMTTKEPSLCPRTRNTIKSTWKSNASGKERSKALGQWN